MSKQEKKALVPVLRFPEFLDKGEWEGKSLSKVFSIFQGFAFSSTDSTKEGIRWLKIADVGIQKMEASTPSYLPNNFQDGYERFLVKLDDYVIALTRPILSKQLKIAKVDSVYDGALLNQRVGKLVTDQNIDFVYFLLQTSQLISEIENNIAGNDPPNLSSQQIGDILVRIPSGKEQQKIADCLTSIDELITAQTQKRDALKAHKKGLMQQLFPAEGETLPKLRFPEFLDKGEWRIKPLGKLFTVGNGKDYKHLLEGDVPVYGSGGYMLSVNDYLYDGESACIGRKGTINNPIFLTGKFWTVDTLFYTHAFKDCSPKFIYLIFQNINWLSHNEAGGVPSLSKANIVKIEVAVPKLSEQQLIVDFISSIDDLITTQTQKINALKAHKKGLMQQLFPVTA